MGLLMSVTPKTAMLAIGVYGCGIGVLMASMKNWMLEMGGVDPATTSLPPHAMMKLTGAIVASFSLGFYLPAGLSDDRAFMWFTIMPRILVLFCQLAISYFWGAAWAQAGFGAFDALTALWHWHALKNTPEKRKPASPPPRTALARPLAIIIALSDIAWGALAYLNPPMVLSWLGWTPRSIGPGHTVFRSLGYLRVLLGIFYQLLPALQGTPHFGQAFYQRMAFFHLIFAAFAQLMICTTTLPAAPEWWAFGGAAWHAMCGVALLLVA